MTDESLTPEELTRQLKLHLFSWQDSGVERIEPVPPEIPVIQPEPSHAVRPEITDQPAEEKSPKEPAKVATEESSLLMTSPDLFFAAEEKNLGPEERRVALEVLAEEVSQCTKCDELPISRTQTVFGEGPLDAELCFIGEAPGYHEDQTGRPFVGDAGQLLDKIIKACGFEREEVFICNILRCRPPNNRTPHAVEATNCRPHLERQLELIRPKWICTLGACPAQHLLGVDTGVGRLRRRLHDYNGIPVLCTYHPSYLLRTPSAKKHVWDDMQMLLNAMGRPIPDHQNQKK
ncbi:MAG: uracil-DNA glycosylase family protein [Gemmataceae bacterium]